MIQGKQIAELALTSSTNYEKDAGIAFSPNGDIIAGGKSGEIVLWDATDGKILMTLPQPEGNQRPTYAVFFHLVGSTYFPVRGWQPGLQKVPIHLWEVATGKNIATVFGCHTTDVQCFAFVAGRQPYW